MSFNPKDAADDSIERALEVLRHARHGAPQDVHDDLVRAALVMGVAALDTYLHAAVMKTIKPWKLPAELSKQTMRLDDVSHLVAVAYDDEWKRPWGLVKSHLRELLLTMSFQAPRAVESAMKMCGVPGSPWNRIAAELGVGVESQRRRLGRIVHRRNKIVHESDLMRFERPRSVKFEDVDAAWVSRELNWLEKLLGAIDTVITG